MDNLVRFFLLKLAPKTMFFYTSLAAISSFANIDGPVAFLLYNLKFYLKKKMDNDIQLILEFKISFGKYHPLCPKYP